MFLCDYVETLHGCSLRQLDHEYTAVFDFCTYSRGITNIFSHLKKTKTKNKNVCLSSDTVKAISFKQCMIILLLGVDQFRPDLRTLTLFQGHRCVRNIICRCMCVRACVRACVRTCVHVCVRACARARVRSFLRVCVRGFNLILLSLNFIWLLHTLKRSRTICFA